MKQVNNICESIQGYNNQRARIERLQDANEYMPVANYDLLLETERITLDNIVITSAITFGMEPNDFIDLIEIYANEGKSGVIAVIG